MSSLHTSACSVPAALPAANPSTSIPGSESGILSEVEFPRWDFRSDPHYQAIAAFYGDRVAQRTQVPLINHIIEGLFILEHRGSSIPARQAYCLHPLVQGDSELKILTADSVKDFDRWALVLALEYRRTANAYLSTREIQSVEEISLSPLPEVNEMLVADKIQNRKDFEKFHKTTHPRSAELQRYFELWIQRLGVTEEYYQAMLSRLQASLAQ